MDFGSMDWTDTTGDGQGNLGLGDSNLDGRYDVAALDGDGDGYVEGYAWDTNGNGQFDTVSLDSDGDGYLDAQGWDVTGDGQIDLLSGPATGGQVVQAPRPDTVTIGGPSGGSGTDALISLLPMAGPYETVLIDRILQSQRDSIGIWTMPDIQVRY
jgi:hypothetical protein